MVSIWEFRLVPASGLVSEGGKGWRVFRGSGLADE
jgi:hypothetical protein